VRTALSYALLVALLAHFGAHCAIAIGLAQGGAYRRAALAFFVAPLAPWWGWEAGMKGRVVAWGTALALYALLVAIA
jgi:hypothetical protein